MQNTTKVAIVGYERDGRAALHYWRDRGAEVTVCDQAEKEVPAGTLTQFGESYLRHLDRFDIIMRTSGLNPRTIIAENPTAASKITTGTNEFLRVCPTRNIIGVTGTKGKGTTSTLIYKI